MTSEGKNLPASDPATLLLLAPRGFCAGVIRAIAIVASRLQNFGRRVNVGAADIEPLGFDGQRLGIGAGASGFPRRAGDQPNREAGHLHPNEGEVGQG